MAETMAAGEETGTAQALAEYQCHKVVRAGRIIGPIGAPFLDVEAADGSIVQVRPPRDLFARGKPEPGDFLVVYRDGYVSWSPGAEFHEGYHLRRPGAD